jgi:prefoldin subunit 5
MKKGLLSILAGALLVVGCQNYDDQFSSLESQINALASTVAGLSQVQSDLSALAGTVNSLSSTVASLGSSIDTAVSNGLADITADIAALQAAVADVASTSDVTALQAAIAAAQSDLDELLANSTVYNDDLNVNSVATLDAFLSMGDGINIINGNVTINVSAGMDATKVQTCRW